MIVIFTIAIGGIAASQIAALNLTRAARESAMAMADLRAAMEELLILPQDEIPDATDGFPAGVPIAKWQDLHLEDQTIVPTYPNFGGGAVPDPLEIVLTVTWSHRGRGDRTLTLATLKTK